ncbi:MAG: hypothetical protein ACI8P3_004622, partial [Saprospiraceae bacterium]
THVLNVTEILCRNWQVEGKHVLMNRRDALNLAVCGIA